MQEPLSTVSRRLSEREGCELVRVTTGHDADTLADGAVGHADRQERVGETVDEVVEHERYPEVRVVGNHPADRDARPDGDDSDEDEGQHEDHEAEQRGFVQDLPRRRVT